MTWQNELRKLDEELASGRISADDYRRRRDEVLTQASAAPAAAPQQPAQPAPGQPSQGPFPPPFQWEAKPPAATAESTQIMRPAQPPQPQQQPQQPGDADRTQVVPGGAPRQDADRTQVVPGGFPQQPQTPPPGYPVQAFPQQPPQGGYDATPPWGSSDQLSDPWGVKQGPEVFDESGGGGKGKVVGIVLAIVLLAGIAFGAYWIWGRGNGDNQAGNDSTATPTTTTSTTPSPPPDPLPVGKIKGKVSTNKSVTAFTDVPNLKYLLDSEAALYTTAGGGKTKLAQFTLDDGSKGIVLIVQATDASAAKEAVTGLYDLQINNGMTPFASTPTNVLASEVDAKGGQQARLRGHYASKDLIVRVDVTAPTLAAAQKGFTDSLDAQLEVLKADG
ncbi:hypothetical protein GCM10022243_28510 [Saccharothrix violaceirubra]|uniref:Flagellar basal body-associated protein FliL n=1 Tax=Saccharothrix violaceirubra TaxID=413306 RepID=A0A7W7T9W2_9PSEU|nr:hypothetical protein [Saccharothrix violaceirubra]MBB4969224.1 hypothetical protein [Saccharothrix violaceirubra]